MRCDSRFHIGEVGVDDSRRDGGQHCDALENFAARRLSRFQHGDGLVIVLNHDFEVLTHLVHRSREAAGYLGFRHVELYHVLIKAISVLQLCRNAGISECGDRSTRLEQGSAWKGKRGGSGFA